MDLVELFGTSIDVVPTLSIIAAVLAIAVLSTIATDADGPWYRELRKPEWQPPRWAFPVAWTIIYALLALSAIIVWNNTDITSRTIFKQGALRTSLILMYAINGALNLAWSFLFFRARSPLLAAFDITALLVTIPWIMTRVWPVSEIAALLLIPYLLWVGLATALNWSIARAN